MKPVLLMILDGWGYAPDAPDNAIYVADTPNWDKFINECPHTLIHTSGEAVGLPDGQMGNSEVGHMNIGAGRIVYQSLTKIQKAVDEHGFADNAALNKACEIDQNNTLHILGLLSPGGVHSHEDHIAAMIDLAKAKGVNHIYLHAFLDGRDVPPRSAKPSLKRFSAMQNKQFTMASITGRYFAMDRDNNWDRVAEAYRVIVDHRADFSADNAVEGLEAAYERGENDEFVKATVLKGAKPMQDGDSVVFMNFRADRVRQLTRVFCQPDFDQFTHRRVDLRHLATLTQYQAELKTDIAFPPEKLKNSLGEIIANLGMKQLRIAETEKYAHVTYFFNGGEETVFPNEDRILVKSPAVATYDLQPQMSAPEVSEKLVNAILSQQYQFICVNFANPDMVGHSGIMDAAVAAVEASDVAMGKVADAAQSVGMTMLITADHGNVEQMINPETGGAMTSHTTNPVPLVLIGEPDRQLKSGGALCDLAPTILHLMGIDKPPEMTGNSLLE
ncbi:MAG: phosphoglycerate mutase (2,3-diphosphoglycerate-independent) [Gammaproteobacteria bacterium]|nr:MAG: phosphoglycerate mutase (2,3-diphosphoglycerate-independent) [Gammaproteobacteria bacterium]